MTEMPASGTAPVRICFLGDVSLNDAYNRLYEKGEDPFSEVTGYLESADLTVANLECLARGTQGTNPLRRYSLSAELLTLQYLQRLRAGLVGLANNHAYDNLDDGFATTVRFLEEAGIGYFGASIEGTESEPQVIEFNNLRVAMLNYVTSDTHPRKPDDSRIKLNWLNLDQVRRDIGSLRDKVDHVVVFPHWGGDMEGSMLPSPGLVRLAHQIIEAGADLIVGHHSHTLQPYEVYRGKHIFYSLGNFCFSDMLIDGRLSESDHGRTARSAILDVSFLPDGYQVKLIPTENRDNTIRLLPRERLTLPNLQVHSWWMNTPLLWKCYYLYEKNIYKIVRYFFANRRNPLRQLFRIKPELFVRVVRNLRNSAGRKSRHHKSQSNET